MKTHVINYTLNKFCPLLIVGAVSFLNFGVNTFEPYLIIGMMTYASYFNYKVGYAVGICESKGLM